MQKNPFDQFDDAGASNPFNTFTTNRDPLAVRRDERADRADARASEAAMRAAAAADRAAANENERLRLANLEYGQRERNSRKSQAAELRNSYETLPSYKAYAQALPSYAAGLGSKPDSAGDLDLIYAYAKVMDPNSVVREGEQASVAGADTWANQTIAHLQKQTGNGGTFRPEFRHRLREEMANRMAQLNQSLIADRVRYKGIADRNGLNPMDVVGEHPGARFQELSERVLGRKQQQLDYNGNPIPHDTTPERPELVGAPSLGTPQLASGGQKTERNPALEQSLTELLRKGADIETLNTLSRAAGYGELDPARVAQAGQWLRAHPQYKGSLFDSARDVPTSGWEDIATSPVGIGAMAAIDGVLGGTSDEITSLLGGGDMADLNARKQGAFAAHPYAALAGQGLGTFGAMYGLGMASRATGLASRFASPGLAGDIAFGTLSGAGQNNDNRFLGAGIGAVGGLAGNLAGRGISSGIGATIRTQPGQAATNAVRAYFGRAPLPSAAPLNAADTIAANAINRIGADNIRTPLTEAADLGIPMALVDTNPALRELGGAAVRRSPAASQIAEDALIPRNRGQYDRFVSSVERDLGPSANIPQMSDDLTRQAQTAAAPLYEQAYRQPVTSTPELESLLNTPFGRSATGRARTIAANERRNPMEMGFVQDADGTVRLNPAPTQQIEAVARARADLDAAQAAYRDARNSPSGNLDSARTRVENAREGLRQAEASFDAAPRAGEAMRQPGYTTQTLDYVKRGMDDVLEQYRNPITNRLVLDEAGRAQNGVKNNLLFELDRLNPTYARARGVYQGPVASRDALIRGQEAYMLPTDQLAVQVGQQTPEHLSQMRLGFQDSLLKRAAGVRDNASPFEATLGTPAMRARLDTLYDSNANVPRLLRTRDIEGGLQQTTNAILGNSRTARNQIADANFSTNPLLEGSLHAGAALATGGASLPGTAARVAGTWARDRLALGLGKQAEAKAEALAPILFDTNPRAALSSLDDVMGRYADWQALVEASRPKRLGMMFNAPWVSTVNQAGNYLTSPKQGQ
ncbi:hypothetical protein [Sphingomonas pseudosanguinis]|uniref:Uncharacterized protein n=1 Tax=Sphingomonas pseudosanguinis TaxID=413712 RepID=A0A7W6F4F5_9SPHN|nr:hypothetical protein [Sphingomonas pseudosanguinis]MBB3880335.1 hypothetical protein [Sphingomonas pseudosanguinis]MBN3536369.1 hypothetical protein [Sphingomonas pseudosanguinis]